MSDPFLPDAARAAALTAALRQRIAGSLAHLAEACAPHAPLDLAAIAAQIGRIAAAPRLRPDLFTLHFAILRAAQAGDRAAIADGFAALCNAAIEPPPGLALRDPGFSLRGSVLSLRGWGDASFAPGEMARLAWVFAVAGDTPLTLRPPAPGVLAAAQAALGAAAAILERRLPALHGEILALVSDILLAEDGGGGATRFDGATAFDAQGALLLNAAELTTPAAALATLVHEAAHALLFAATEGASLALNDPAERFASPLRRDARPMGGICHAAFVSARMVHALDAVAEGFAPADRAEAARLRDAAWHAHAAADAVIRAHGRLTEAGAAFLGAARRHMAAAGPG